MVLVNSIGEILLKSSIEQEYWGVSAVLAQGSIYIWGRCRCTKQAGHTVCVCLTLPPPPHVCVSHNSRPTNNLKWACIDFYIFELPKSLLTLGGASECTVFVCLLLPPVCVTHLSRPTNLPGEGHINQTACQ